MLTVLKLSNFRVFDDEVMVRFRPITIFIGRNSSGKSSIIKFLLMLQQSMDSARSQFLTAEGDKVNLGVFSELKNNLTRKRSLRFELEAKNTNIKPHHVLLRSLELPEDFDGNRLVYSANASVSYSRRANIGRKSFRLSDETSGETLVKIDSKILDDSVFGDYTPDSKLAEPPSRSDDLEGSPKKMMKQLHQQMRSLARYYRDLDVVGTIKYQIDSLRHLLPVRTESQRVVVLSAPPVDNVGKMGEFALPHLYNIATENQEGYEFILPYLRNVAGIDEVDFKTSTRYVSQAFARNITTGADVHIADYGFGVSQCLPILVQGVIMPRYTTLMVEQPEAQLHPTAQLELGSFFAELWKIRNVGCILETHSANVLLRLRRLIANGELTPDDVSVAFFTFDDNNQNMPIVRNLDVNEDGSMEAGLPMEFFGADVIEGLQLGARK